MKSKQMKARRGYQDHEFFDQLQRIEQEMRRAIASGMWKLVHKLALRAFRLGLLPWRSVLANVEFPLELDGVPRGAREAVAARCVAVVGLFERHYPHKLSGGMQQRVGIARALTRQPLVLL